MSHFAGTHYDENVQRRGEADGHFHDDHTTQALDNVLHGIDGLLSQNIPVNPAIHHGQQQHQDRQQQQHQHFNGNAFQNFQQFGHVQNNHSSPACFVNMQLAHGYAHPPNIAAGTMSGYHRQQMPLNMHTHPNNLVHLRNLNNVGLPNQRYNHGMNVNMNAPMGSHMHNHMNRMNPMAHMVHMNRMNNMNNMNNHMNHMDRMNRMNGMHGMNMNAQPPPMNAPMDVQREIQRQFMLAQQVHQNFTDAHKQPKPSMKFQPRPIRSIDENKEHPKNERNRNDPVLLRSLQKSLEIVTPCSSERSHSALSSVATQSQLKDEESSITKHSNEHKSKHERDTDSEHQDDDDLKYDDTGSAKRSVLYQSSLAKVVAFWPDGKNDAVKLQLKDYVFISKECTARLSAYIVGEHWGKDYGLLYKYLDYIFRCQSYKQNTVIINDRYLVFHSGLQRRSDKKFLYCVLVRNKKYVTQKWRVQFGNIKNSFVSKAELLGKLTDSFLIADYLPKRTRFFNDLSELLYDDSYSIEVNWEERLTTNKDRISRILGDVAFFDSNYKFMKLSDLIAAFEKSLHQTTRIAQHNPRLAVAQGFIDSKHSTFRLELLLPLIIEFPKNSGSFYIFALAINKSQEAEKTYVVKSILTFEMAYANARLVGYVDSTWLYFGANNDVKSNINDFFCYKR
eukprot:CAMPEP_0202726586 /NCGR_PEP_ID=MMETSP1385-20130828/184684_1 /ASSEMBLY_ACC=CAM_ASM_000861 /TAXON_ID=933848 /ORGANISM="Elphidium margaritaceum" /LENGTH=674 /DNA_ID=CAMNT_0049392809 /DNA_START=81 /DNA_END=2105 /DNA_ORIENTATION=+